MKVSPETAARAEALGITYHHRTGENKVKAMIELAERETPVKSDIQAKAEQIDRTNQMRESMKATEETKQIAAKLNIKHHPNISEATLQERINAQPQAYQNAAKAEVSAPVVEEKHDNTPEQVLDAIKHLTSKPGFEAKFDTNEGTWQFSYRGSVDSGNLKIPMKVIVLKALGVSKGAYVPRTDTNAIFDTNVRGSSKVMMMN